MADPIVLLQTAFAHISQGQLPPAEVLKALVSKGLGYGIIAGSTLVKLPQILNILRAGSAEGLSALSFELDTWVLMVQTCYGYMMGLPFSAFGEASILFIQNLLLVGLIYKFGKVAASRALLTSSVAVGSLGVVATGKVSKHIITRAYDANNVIMLVSRLPQVYKNFKEKNTGQLSLITFSVNTVGCVARIFTTINEGGGDAMLRAYIIALILNAVLVAQILIYGNKASKVKAVKDKRKKADKKKQ